MNLFINFKKPLEKKEHLTLIRDNMTAVFCDVSAITSGNNNKITIIEEMGVDLITTSFSIKDIENIEVIEDD